MIDFRISFAFGYMPNVLFFLLIDRFRNNGCNVKMLSVGKLLISLSQQRLLRVISYASEVSTDVVKKSSSLRFNYIRLELPRLTMLFVTYQTEHYSYVVLVGIHLWFSTQCPRNVLDGSAIQLNLCICYAHSRLLSIVHSYVVITTTASKGLSLYLRLVLSHF